MDGKEVKVKMVVEGMTCKGCEKQVTEALQSIEAKNVDTSFSRGETTFEIDENKIKKIKEAISKSGYQPGDEEIIKRERDNFPSLDGEYDLLLIGSGGAAFAAAIKAVENGARVGMIERGTVGGTCVNIGCVPSKTMLRAGEINHFATLNPFQGLHTSSGTVELSKLTEQKDELVENLRNQKYVDLIEEYGIELIKGEAKFVDEKTIEVGGQSFTAKRFLIATGASPLIPNIPGLKKVDFLTSTSALELKELPKRLVVIGSGYIAMELGQMFHNLGVKVTLMQRSDRVLKSYDPEVSDAVVQALREQGIELITGVTYEKVEQEGELKFVHFSVNDEQKLIEAEQLLVATGRKPNTATLQLGKAGVEVGSRNEVVVNEYLETTNPRIYAAGDVTLGPQFVYVAAYEGGIVADNALGTEKRRIDLRFVPGVTFTNPSVATVGLTEAQAKKEGYNVKTSVLALDAVPRALVNRETTGVFKLVVDEKTQKLIGAHIVSENAGEVIYAATLAVQFGLTTDDLKGTLSPYLTMAEGLKLAALTFDKDVSKLSCCAG